MKSLSRHLKPLSHDSLMDIAERAGITLRVAAAARYGNPVSADNYLRLCNASGLDPVSGKSINPTVVGKLNMRSLAKDVRLKRAKRACSVRLLAKKLKLGPATITRLEKGDAASIKTVLKACAYVGAHPFQYMHAERDVAGETSMDSNTRRAA